MLRKSTRTQHHLLIHILADTMSSASSSTVTAHNVNARRHASNTPTQSSHHQAHSRQPHTHSRPSRPGAPPSVVSSELSSSYTPTRAGSLTPTQRGRGAGAGAGVPSSSPRSVTGNSNLDGLGGNENGKGRIPITPAVLRDIFASSRTLIEERTISRVAFFRYVQLNFDLATTCEDVV